MPELSGQLAIITGVASGIGKEIAKRFAIEGATVVIADLHLPAAQAAPEDINRAGGIPMGLQRDVSDELAGHAALAAAAGPFRRVDILVSNGCIQIVRPVEQFPFFEWKKMLAIHLDGAFLTTKACLRYMYKANRGAIIYIGSVHSKEASLLKAPYVTSKHGLVGLC